MSTELDLSRRSASAAPATPVNLAGLGIERLRTRLAEIGIEPRKVKMRANQVSRWI